MSYKFELMCLSWDCEGQTIKVYEGLKQACEDLGNIEECPECGLEFEITENHIFVRETGTKTFTNLGSRQEPCMIYKPITTTFSDSDLCKIIRAIEFTAFKHRNQRRKDKDEIPYINHSIETLSILWRIGKVRYVPILVAIILHDIIKEADTKPEEILYIFGQEVFDLVMEVTDDKSLPKEEIKRLQIDNAPNKSTGAKLISIADKISNVNSWPDWPKERFAEYLDWTEDVMKGLRNTNQELENYYDIALSRSRQKVANWDTNKREPMIK